MVMKGETDTIFPGGIRYNRGLPAHFRDYPLVRSYATTNYAGVLCRVEVRRDPASGHTVQAVTPMPSSIHKRCDTARRA